MGEFSQVIVLLAAALVCLLGVRIILRHEITRRELDEKQKVHDAQMQEFEVLRSSLAAKKAEFDALAINKSLTEVYRFELWSAVDSKIASAVLKLIDEEIVESLRLMNEALQAAEKTVEDLRSAEANQEES